MVVTDLPRQDKLVRSGAIRSNDGGNARFFSSLDTIGGLSGGPVVDATTGVVEGIHVTGPVPRYWQYVPESGCSTAAPG